MHTSINIKKEGKFPIVTEKKTEIEPELRPDFIRKIKRIEKANKKPIPIENINDLFVSE